MAQHIKSLTTSQLKFLLLLRDSLVKTVNDAVVSLAATKKLNEKIGSGEGQSDTDKVIHSESVTSPSHHVNFPTATSRGHPSRSDLDTSIAASVPSERPEQVRDALPPKVEEVNQGQPSILNLNLPSYLANLKMSFSKGDQDAKVDAIPKWKLKKRDIISQTSIDGRTKYLAMSLNQSKSVPDSLKLRRLEDFCQHIRKFPQAQGLAVKLGAIPFLLRIQSISSDSSVLELSREGLSLLGYTEPVIGRGIRVLSIDGGGTRGLIAIAVLRKMQELTGLRVHEMFDLICGVSTGSILACLLGMQRMELDACEQLYRDISTKVFTQNALKGTSSLVWSHSYYNTGLWEEILKSHVGEKSMIEFSRASGSPKVAAISAIVNQIKVMPYIFRSYNLPYRSLSHYDGSSEYFSWEAVRASAAAPTYFQEFLLGDRLHQDGGIIINNPCAVGIHEARLLWPNSKLECVISLGTGRFHPIELQLSSSANGKQNKGLTLSWRNKFAKILDSATDTEGVHLMLDDLLPGHVYYRFNPPLSSIVDLDEVKEDNLKKLVADTELYLRVNERKMQKACSVLMSRKPFYQKCNERMAKLCRTMLL